MNCALPVLLSFVYPGHDASCPYIYHSCTPLCHSHETCPRPDRGMGIYPILFCLCLLVSVGVLQYAPANDYSLFTND